MAIYYVSNQRGDDLNNGLSPSTPWATVTKAVQTLGPGDTCYIGPGTYREALTNANAGTSGNLIQFIGDPDVQYVVGDTKGIVRITACDEDEMAGYDSVWICNKDYVIIKNLLLDGGYDGIFFWGVAENRYAERVIAIGCGFTGGTLSNCISITPTVGFALGVAINCLAIAGMVGYETNKCINCIAIGMAGFSGDLDIINSLALGCYLGFDYVTSYNCVALGTAGAFRRGRAFNGLAVACDQGYIENVYANDCKYSMCNLPYMTYRVDPGYDDPVEAPVMLWTFNQIQKVMEAFDPWMFEAAERWGRLTDRLSNPLNLPDTDILGRARRMEDSLLDVGPYALSRVSPDFEEYETDPPSIKIEGSGMKLFEIPATGGEEITISMKVKYVDSLSAKAPRIILRGETITEQVATHPGVGGLWIDLSVSATPDKDELLTLILYARDVGATCYFSDIQVV
jgi:hypothetical protein